MPENRKQSLVELAVPIAGGCVDGVCEIPGNVAVPDSEEESGDDEITR